MRFILNIDYFFLIHRYQIVQMCVALALGCEKSQQDQEEEKAQGDKLLLDLWETLTQYSKFVLQAVCTFVISIRISFPIQVDSDV